MIRLVADHPAEGTLRSELHRHHPEAHPENPVQRSGRTAALKMAEYAGPGILASQLLDPRSNLLADATETDFTRAFRIDGDGLSIRHVGTFRHDDEGAVVAIRIALSNVRSDFFEGKWNFR